MAKLIYDPVTLIKEYGKRLKKDGIILSDEQINDICKYQFALTRREMELGTLRTVRIKYLGSFQVFKGRVIGIKNKVHEMMKSGKMRQETAMKLEDLCEMYLMNEEIEETSDKVLSNDILS